VRIQHRLVSVALAAALVTGGAGCSGTTDGPPVALPPPAVALDLPDHAWLPTTVPPIVGGQLVDVAGSDRGFVAVGSVQDPAGDSSRGLVLFSDEHGHPAEEATTAAVLPSGTLLVGYANPPCGLLSSSCGLESTAWWSTDARSWAAVPHGTPGWPFRYASVTSDGGGLAIAYADRQAWASNDGWRWTPMTSAEAPGEGSANGIAATPGRLVAVGTSFPANGRTVPWIGTAVAP
jgi:hypothetical protein